MYARKRLGELLVEAGAIDEFQLSAALGHQRQWGGRLGRTLVDMKVVPEPAVVSALARRLECEVAHLDGLERSPALSEALALVTGDFARRHLVLPVALKRNELQVAMADPTNVAAIDELSFRTGRRVKVFLAGEREVARAVKRFYGEAAAADAIAVDFDRGPSAEDDAPVFDQSAAQYQERFYSWTFRSPGGESPLEQVAAARAAPAPVRPAPPLAANAAPPSLPRARRPAAPGLSSVPTPVGAAPGALPLALEKLAAGASLHALAPHALAAAIAAVLIRRGLVTEAELLAEVARQRGASAPRV
jgi:type IV pilus assembly protein PilB